MNEHTYQHITNLTNKNFLILELSDLYREYTPHCNSIDVSEINVDVLNSSDSEIVLIDLASPYQRNVDETNLYDILSAANITKKWLIITSNCQYYKSNHLGIVYYPIYLIDGIDKAMWQSVDIAKNRTHNVSFLTYHMHWHRILVMLALHKNQWFDTCLMNLMLVDDMNESQIVEYNNATSTLTLAERNQLDLLMQHAPMIADVTDGQLEIVSIHNIAFTESYINLFTESDYPAIFITEKSIKPFLSGQFTAVLSHPEVYRHLTALGFDIFDDIIDMSTNNIEGGVRANIDNVIAQIDKLIPNIEQVWDDTFWRRRHNYILARSPELRTELCRELKERLCQ